MSKFYWVMFSGKTMLCFTMRTTRKQCIENHLWERGRNHLCDEEKCKKVSVALYTPNANGE